MKKIMLFFVLMTTTTAMADFEVKVVCSDFRLSLHLASNDVSRDANAFIKENKLTNVQVSAPSVTIINGDFSICLTVSGEKPIN